jgi:glycosyltransferase involved in cell wall biosynthesis
VIGWTGSNTTAPYLELVRPALAALQREVEFEFRVICDVDPGFPEIDRYRFVKWRQESEIADLDEFDIGLMPVPNGTWEKGKVGFKGIQYSAMGIVPVVSSTGSGPEVVEHGKTGLVVDNTTEAWQAALGSLVRNPHLIAQFGAAAREKVLGTYSVIAVASNYVRLFS